MAPEEWQHPHIVTPRSAEMSPVTVLDYCCISFAVEQSQSPVRDPMNDSLENNDTQERRFPHHVASFEPMSDLFTPDDAPLAFPDRPPTLMKS